ncbi:MAG: glycosyltransferase [Hymenobacter sp.]|nr:MAG: glycosyltransferase [Hymenobacter sp.]
MPTWLRARLGGQPFIYDAHELFTDVPEVVARPAVRRAWQRVENLIVPRARLRYTVGPALARLFEERHPGCPFAVVRNAPVGEELAAGLAENQPPAASSQQPGTLLYQGALNAGRGLEALLDAMPQVPARLVICGEGDLSAALRAQAGRLGLLASGQVEFKGYVLPAELRRLTAQATVGIMLLENVGLSYYYSLANKFFDYVQAGIPQLCIDFPEYRALCQQHPVAELVPDLAPTTLVAALARLLPDGQPGAHYQRLAAACQAARCEWTWEREAHTLRQLYEEAVGPPAAVPAAG